MKSLPGRQITNRVSHYVLTNAAVDVLSRLFIIAFQWIDGCFKKASTVAPKKRNLSEQGRMWSDQRSNNDKHSQPAAPSGTIFVPQQFFTINVSNYAPRSRGGRRNRRTRCITHRFDLSSLISQLCTVDDRRRRTSLCKGNPISGTAQGRSLPYTPRPQRMKTTRWSTVGKRMLKKFSFL
jgi:hypothetical protein